MAETMRGALESVSAGQVEAGYCVRLNYLLHRLRRLLHRLDHRLRGFLNSLHHRLNGFLHRFNHGSSCFLYGLRHLLDCFRRLSHTFDFLFHILSGCGVKNLECLCHV